MTTDTEERGYFKFRSHAEVTQALKEVLRRYTCGGNDREVRELVEQLCYTMAPIINGDYKCRDHWVDIIAHANMALLHLKIDHGIES